MIESTQLPFKWVKNLRIQIISQHTENALDYDPQTFLMGSLRKYVGGDDIRLNMNTCCLASHKRIKHVSQAYTLVNLMPIPRMVCDHENRGLFGGLL